MSPKQTKEDKLTREQAAQFLGVNMRTLYRLTQAGKLTRHQSPVGVGRGGLRYYYLRSDLAKIKAQMIEPATDPDREHKEAES